MYVFTAGFRLKWCGLSYVNPWRTISKFVWQLDRYETKSFSANEVRDLASINTFVGVCLGSRGIISLRGGKGGGGEGCLTVIGGTGDESCAGWNQHVKPFSAVTDYFCSSNHGIYISLRADPCRAYYYWLICSTAFLFRGKLIRIENHVYNDPRHLRILKRPICTSNRNYLAEDTHHRGKYHCTADLLFDYFGFAQTSKIYVDWT